LKDTKTTREWLNKKINKKRGCSKMNSFCYSLFWAGRKIAQIGQTERK